MSSTHFRTIVRPTLLRYTFTRPESWLCALCWIIFTGFNLPPNWLFWIVFWPIVWLVIWWTGINDVAELSKVAAGILQPRVNPNTIGTAAYREFVIKAVAIQDDLESILQRNLRTEDQTQARYLADLVWRWTTWIHYIATQLDLTDRNEIITESARSIKEDMAALKVKVAQEQDGDITAALQATLGAMIDLVSGHARLGKLKVISATSLQGTLANLQNLHLQVYAASLEQASWYFPRLGLSIAREIRVLALVSEAWKVQTKDEDPRWKALEEAS